MLLVNKVIWQGKKALSIEHIKKAQIATSIMLTNCHSIYMMRKFS